MFGWANNNSNSAFYVMYTKITLGFVTPTTLQPFTPPPTPLLLLPLPLQQEEAQRRKNLVSEPLRLPSTLPQSPSRIGYASAAHDGVHHTPRADPAEVYKSPAGEVSEPKKDDRRLNH